MFDPSNPRTMRDYIRIFLSGFAMGSADIVPGVSGGTMAFILGIYEALLDGIKSFNFKLAGLVIGGKLREAMAAVPWQFLVTLGLGLVTAILMLTRFLTWMLEDHPEYLFAFFFGLVLASIIAIGAKITEWNVTTVGGLVAGIAIALLIVTQNPMSDDNHSTMVLFFSGMIAIMAMILPGISGSFILLLLGQYEYVLNAVKDFDFATIITVGVGAVVGLLGFSRVLSWLLKTYEMLTIAILTGFMAGSLWKIWPWREAPNVDVADHAEEFTNPVLPQVDTSEFWFAMLLMFVGFGIVTALDHMQSRANPFVMLVNGTRTRRSAPVK